METISLSDYQSIYTCGDIHGEFESLVYNVTIRHKIRNAVVIVAGDCGFGFYTEEHYKQVYEKIKKRLIEANVIILCVRGNHDDPSCYNGVPFIFPHLRTIPDYTVVSVANHNILCVGGAISVDRQDRKVDYLLRVSTKPTYWIDENFSFIPYELQEIKDARIQIDTVITHTAPSFCPPALREESRWYANDPTLKEDVAKDRAEVDRLYYWLTVNNMPLKQWYYGHFHAPFKSEYEGKEFTGLDIQQLTKVE